jgi:hypothetical protein
MALTVREFRRLILKPNLDEYMRDYQLMHRAFNAVAAVDAYAAHIFYQAKEMSVDICTTLSLDQPASRDDSAFRQALADNCNEFKIIRDLAKANKHARLIRHSPRVADSGQTSAKSKGWGEARWGEGRYGSPLQIFVEVDGSEECYVETLIQKSVDMLDRIAKELGLDMGHAD